MTPAAASLEGRRVLITRADDDAAEWAQRIASYGAKPVLLPCIRCESIDTPELRTALAAAAAAADWVVFTSRRGVEAFAALRADAQPSVAARTKIAVVGAATADAARALLGRADLVGAGTAAELGGLLAATLAAERDAEARTLGASSAQCLVAIPSNVVLALAANAGHALERALGSGARCTRLDVYRTIPAAPAAPKRALSSLGADNVLLASPSAVSGFVQQVTVDAPLSIYTIGPSTTAAARAEGLAVTAEAREPSLEGLVEAMHIR